MHKHMRSIGCVHERERNDENAMKFNRIGITIRIGLEKMNGQLINYATGTYTQIRIHKKQNCSPRKSVFGRWFFSLFNF